MTSLEFMKEEYLTLRREVEGSVSELATLERQCVLAIAALYAWLATAGLQGEVVLQIAWSIPVLIAVFGALRSLSAGQHLRRLSAYIQQIELEVAQSNRHATGWEHFHARTSASGLRTRVRFAAWVALIVLTLIVAHEGPQIAFEAGKPVQSSAQQVKP